MGKVILALCIAVCGANAVAEQWANHYYANNTDTRALSVQALAEGGYVVAGGYWFGGRPAGWVVKVDADGQMVWQRAYGDGGHLDHIVLSARSTADGGYVAAGYIQLSTTRRDALVLKLDAGGGIVWQRTYGGASQNWFSSIRATADGGYVAAGSTAVNVAWILRLDGVGNVLWERAYKGPDWHDAYEAVQTSDGGFAVVGRRLSIGTAPKWLASLTKLDAFGNLEWQKAYGAGIEIGNAVRQTPDGGYVIAGETQTFGSGRSDAWVLRLDRAGNVLWQRAYGGADDDRAYGIALAADGGYVVTGETQSLGGGSYYDAFVMKLDADGNIAWQRLFGGKYNDVGKAVEATGDGGYVVAGYGARPLDQAWLLKLDGNGAVGDCAELSTARALATEKPLESVALPVQQSAIASIAAPSAIVPQSPPAAVEQTCRAGQSPNASSAIEYYHSEFDHYFVTALRTEIAALDSGSFAGWSRTGQSFDVLPVDTTGASNVCRFWSGQSFYPRSSHFYTPFAAECAIVKTNRDWQFEGEVFAIALPDENGQCRTGALPIYRLYNNGMGNAPNHRYTTSYPTRAVMVVKGWIPEGSGIGVIGCAPAP